MFTWANVLHHTCALGEMGSCVIADLSKCVLAQVGKWSLVLVRGSSTGAPPHQIPSKWMPLLAREEI